MTAALASGPVDLPQPSFGDLEELRYETRKKTQATL